MVEFITIVTNKSLLYLVASFVGGPPTRLGVEERRTKLMYPDLTVFFNVLFSSSIIMDGK